MIAEKPSWIRHEGMQIFSIDVQPGGLRFATGGGDHKVWLLSCPIIVCLVADKIQEMGNTMTLTFGFFIVGTTKRST
jgi:hypothetical protein